MEPLLTSEEMRRSDSIAIKRFHMPGLALMENAGHEVSNVVAQLLGDVRNKHILILCGKGNNGGDGFVAARHLANQGAQIDLFLIGKRREVRGDAKLNLEILLKIARGNSLVSVTEFRSLKQLASTKHPDLIIDALLGTGSSGELRPPYRGIVNWVNSQKVQKLAVDIPTGVDADSGFVPEVAIKADVTVTMAAKKVGLVVGKGSAHAGKIKIASIGMPTGALDQSKPRSFLVELEDVRRVLPPRPFNAHKHSVGKLLVIAGSRGLTGAAALTCESAMRAGAGAVVLLTPDVVYPILGRKLTEVMVHPIKSTSQGNLGLDALPVVEKFTEWADAVVIGPGISTAEETRRLVLSVMKSCPRPLLMDADALNALATHQDGGSVVRARRRLTTLLTPHVGELSRMTGFTSEEIERDRVAVARAVAHKFKCTLVLKGAPTVVATPVGELFVNSTGNPGLATAGSGDVLAGILGTLLAKGLSVSNAAFAGVYLHGLAADLASKRYGQESMVAGDVIEFLPAAFQVILESN